MSREDIYAEKNTKAVYSGGNGCVWSGYADHHYWNQCGKLLSYNIHAGSSDRGTSET